MTVEDAAAPGTRGTIVQVSVSPGGVPKLPVAQARVATHGVEGDRQRDLRSHGGPDRAVCLYSLERIEALRAEGHGVEPGATGENLTVRGLDWDLVAPGAVLRAGDALLEITAYTAPCKNQTGFFVEGRITRISQKVHPGWSRVYARVLEEGVVRAGDPVELVAAPGRAVPAEREGASSRGD